MTNQAPSQPTGAVPPEYVVVMSPQDGGTTMIDFGKLFRKLWESRYLITAVSLLFAIMAGIHALFLAVPVYEARAVVAVRVEDGLSGGGGNSQLNGLASLAGVNLRNGSLSRIEFVATLSSRDLAEKFVRRYNLLPVFFPDLYDARARAWRDPKKVPTITDGVAVLQSISRSQEDVATGLISLYVEWKDRFLAARWARDYIALANSELRASAQREAQNNLNYLAGQAKIVQIEALRESVVRLTESNLNRLMLANAQPNFAFKFIDPPIVADPDKFIYPARKFQVVAGFFSGFILAVIFVLWRKRKT